MMNLGNSRASILSDLPEELFGQLEMLAGAAGSNDLKSYVIAILEEKIQAAKNKKS